MNRRFIKYYLCIGSNRGNRTANIKKALDFLCQLGEIIKISSFYKTEPVEMAAGTEDFYNLVLCLKTTLTPHTLLTASKEFERNMGRDITHSHQLPRTIDIDILLADQLIIDTHELAIPHKEMSKRKFVLVPLMEIAPTAVHPLLKMTVREILEQLPPLYQTYQVRKM
jgi:2-amino-4-hydroxy-6-hydroxymethyldihydropteridine diphosphokinase